MTPRLAVTFNDTFPAGYIVTRIRQDEGAGKPVVISGSVPTTGASTQALLYCGPIYRIDSSGCFQLMPSFSGQEVTSATFALWGRTKPVHRESSISA